jgi:hypothetical protein
MDEVDKLELTEVPALPELRYLRLPNLIETNAGRQGTGAWQRSDT